MAEVDFKVQQIDHIHVFVTDQREAARWYRENLGLEILTDYEHWAEDDGPLTISSDGGNTSLALFRKEGRAIGEVRNTIAFRVDADDFLLFLARLETFEMRDKNGNRVKASDVEDHGKSYSIYFCDPDGNPYELTTYDYQSVYDRLNR
jgi:catechol 2,3-dioxygenase-like lactoylglutathione lyase family enzyme